MIILRTCDTVPCQLGDLTVWISPLSWGEKSSLSRFTKQNQGETTIDETAMLLETLRLSVKKVDGFEKNTFPDGSPATLNWVDGKLDQESIEMLVQVMGIVPVSKLSSAVLSDTLASGVDGFEVDVSKSQTNKKK